MEHVTNVKVQIRIQHVIGHHEGSGIDMSPNHPAWQRPSCKALQEEREDKGRSGKTNQGVDRTGLSRVTEGCGRLTGMEGAGCEIIRDSARGRYIDRSEKVR